MRGDEDPGEPLATLALDVLPRLVRRLAEVSTGDPTQPLTLSQVRLLKRVAAGCRLMSELAGDLDVAPPTVSAAVDGLVRRGLLLRQGGAADRRTVPLVLTAAGEAALAAAQARQVRALTDMFAHLDEGARQALGVGLRALRSVL
jgi:DNA-binding MarR family transcriptional regulator